MKKKKTTVLTARYQGWGKIFYIYILLRVAASLIEVLECNLLARIKDDAWIQTQWKMLIEFRGSELWNHQWVNSISSRRKQIFLLPAGSFTDCISAAFDVFTYSSRWRGPASFSDSRLQQLPSSCCWTRGANPIKNEWEQARLRHLCQILMHPRCVFGCRHAELMRLSQQRRDWSRCSIPPLLQRLFQNQSFKN